MKKQPLSNLPNGYLKMENEAEQVFKHLEICATSLLEQDAALNIKFFKTKLLDKSYNLQVNNHTLVIQLSMPVLKSTTNSFLSLAIYDRIFNQEGFAIDKYGIPETFPIDKHLLHYAMFELFATEGNELVWATEEKPDNIYNSEELVSKWVFAILDKVYNKV